MRWHLQRQWSSGSHQPWRRPLLLLFWVLLLSLGIGLLTRQAQSSPWQLELIASKPSPLSASGLPREMGATWLTEYLRWMRDSESTKPGGKSGSRAPFDANWYVNADCRNLSPI